MKRLIRRLALAGAICMVPALAHAQASIVGVVKDASGAVLPGVTVEAASPALIERVRTVVTDGTGQYQIIDLRPGAYSVTFTLPGFSSVKREGVELAGSFTATINVELKVGTVSETVTVTGEAPVVDVQSVKRQAVVGRDVLAELPIARSFHSVAYLVPGITLSTTTDVGGLAGPFSPTFGIHGGPNTEGRLQVDGVSVGASLGGSGVSGYVSDVGNSQELTFSTSGGLGESEVGGPIINVVPRTGGNMMSGQLFATGASGAMQGDNFTQALKDAGLRVPATLDKIWDVNGAVGGPVRKDRLWYFFTARHQGNRKTVAGMYENLNAGDPALWTYAPDLSQQARNDGTWKNASLRMTFQASPRNKFNLFWDEQSICQLCIWGGNATTSPEANSTLYNHPSRVQQITWTSPTTNRLLLEAGLGTVLIGWGSHERDNSRDLIRVTEQCSAGCAANGSIPGLTYRSQNWSNDWIGAPTWHASASYVTGAHNMKFGYQGAYYVDDQKNFTNNANLAFRVNNGVPNQLTMTALPYPIHNRTSWAALFAQDQWKLGRLTLQGAVRYDRAWSVFPAQQIGPTNFLPTPLAFPDTDGVKGYNDITPRVGVAYDLSGNGRTALKLNVGKYLAAASNYQNYTGPNPISRVATSVTRTWTDANGNFTPDCNLLNPGSQDLRSAAGDFCGAISNQNFGRPVFSNTYDPGILQGWGVRPSDWGLGVSVQHEVLTRVSAEVGYYRRWFQNFTVTDNLAVASSDFTGFSVTAPADARLPGGGGNLITGLYDVNPTLFGMTNNYVTYAGNFGNQYQVPGKAWTSPSTHDPGRR